MSERSSFVHIVFETAQTVLGTRCVHLFLQRKRLCEKPPQHVERFSSGRRSRLHESLMSPARATLECRSTGKHFLNRFSAVLCTVAVFFTAGCNDMYDSARLKPLERSAAFADGAAARPLPEGTVARGAAIADDLLSTGRINGQVADTFPFVLSEEILKRGQKQFTTFCTPCHGSLGDGNGMIVQRGFPRPNSFHSDSVRARPVGYYFDVMTNGFGKMYSYASSITPSDRWAIAAYIRALQLSQRTAFGSLSEEEKKKVSAPPVRPVPEGQKKH